MGPIEQHFAGMKSVFSENIIKTISDGKTLLYATLIIIIYKTIKIPHGEYMYLVKELLVLSTIAAVAGCGNVHTVNSTVIANQKKQSESVHYELNKIVYNGHITSDLNNEFFKLYLEHSKLVTEIEITSKGGSIDLGIDLAEFVHKHKLDVLVSQICLSSCANYVFPAGKNKYLTKHAALAYHGGAHDLNMNLLDAESQEAFDQSTPEEQKKTIEKMNEFFTRIKHREEAFFKSINVSNKLTYIGQNKSLYQGPADGWYLPLDQMKKLGVTNIKVIGGDWDPTGISEFDFINSKEHHSNPNGQYIIREIHPKI